MSNMPKEDLCRPCSIALGGKPVPGYHTVWAGTCPECGLDDVTITPARDYLWDDYKHSLWD